MLSKEPQNSSIHALKSLENADKITKNLIRPLEWKGYTDRQKDEIDVKLIIPRERKSEYGNKFFIPGTTMRTRIESNALPIQKYV
jgi:hypothetical protein